MINRMENPREPRIVFFGTSKFSVKILEAMKKAGFTPALIVTALDKPKGRKLKMASSPVKEWAIKNGVKFTQPNKIEDLRINLPAGKARIQDLGIKPDLFVVASFGKILPKEILEIPKYGTLNVHPSLLPKLRGPSPVQSAILNGEKETGVTIMLMNEKMDEGPILAAQELEFLTLPTGRQVSNFEFLKLENELAKFGGKLLVETIPEWIDGKIKPIPQDNNKATYTKIIKKSDGEIDWNKPAEIIERKIRAFTPWPSAYTFYKGKRIIVTEAELDKNGKLAIKRVRPEGKNEISYKEFLNNNPDINF